MTRFAELLQRPTVATGLVVLLLFGGLLVDLTTRQDLVVAIIYNIPIAVSGFGVSSRSRRLTTWAVVLALAANLAAAYENALQVGGYEGVTVANRGLAALSFLIVGAMTLARESAVEEVSELGDAEASGQRERALRRVLAELGDAFDEEELLRQSVPQLRRLLQADAVAVVGVDDGRFVEPRFGDQPDELAPLGSLASWAVDAIPTNDRPAIATRSEHGIVTTGRLRRDGAPDLVVVADRPREQKSAYLLGEALHDLEPLLRRARDGADTSTDDAAGADA